MRLRRHIVCSHNDALTIALWVMFSWTHDEIATHSPILDITSAEPESGKTTTLGLISFLAPRCLSSVEISEAALFRSIELWQPSFAIDEFDVVLASDEKAGLRSIINSGHTRGQGIVRCIEPDFRPQMFKTFAPKAIGMVGRKMPASTLSRCIMVKLRRRRKGEHVEKFTHKDDAGLADLRSRLFRWSLDNVDTLRGAKPSMPEQFDNRRPDNWSVQLAITDLCGEDWGDKARLAAIELEGASDSRTAGAKLLEAIRSISREEGVGDAIGSQGLRDKLTANPDSEWAEWRRGNPITQMQIARLLKPFRIFPQQVRVGGRQIRGYSFSSFRDAWGEVPVKRHIPPFPPSKASQVSQTRMAVGQLARFKVSQQPPFVTPQKVQETRMALGFVTPVTGWRGGIGPIRRET
jgi:putative DNA primase/helicase